MKNDKFTYNLPKHITDSLEAGRLKKPNGQTIKTLREARDVYMQQQSMQYEPQSEYEG
jgi:hypothetical protein|tara:strand:- start:4608 stop:4781 length:174 start_codon:yes stop_codon:yes gene_type:complete